MYSREFEQRIDLIELIHTIWRRKWLIAAAIILFTLAGLVFTYLATPVYRAEVVLLPNLSDAQSTLPSTLGGIASLTGITLGVPGDETEAVAILRSKIFIEDFIRSGDLLPVLFHEDWDPGSGTWTISDPNEWPDLRDGVTYFSEEILEIEQDAGTGIITLSIEWNDPERAAHWADHLVQQINDRLKTRDLSNSERRIDYLNNQLSAANLVELRQAISRLIESEIQTVMLAKAEDEYAFKVIDPPRVPKKPIFPSKLAIMFFAAFMGALISTIVLVCVNWRKITSAEHLANGNE